MKSFETVNCFCFCFFFFFFNQRNWGWSSIHCLGKKTDTSGAVLSISAIVLLMAASVWGEGIIRLHNLRREFSKCPPWSCPRLSSSYQVPCQQFLNWNCCCLQIGNRSLSILCFQWYGVFIYDILRKLKGKREWANVDNSLLFLRDDLIHHIYHCGHSYAGKDEREAEWNG